MQRDADVNKMTAKSMNLVIIVPAMVTVSRLRREFGTMSQTFIFPGLCSVVALLLKNNNDNTK